MPSRPGLKFGAVHLSLSGNYAGTPATYFPFAGARGYFLRGIASGADSRGAARAAATVVSAPAMQ